MTPRELAQVLLERARDDLAALEDLAANSKLADWVIGFHAQQCVEKCLKAVLAEREVAFQRQHDLIPLIELLEDDGGDLPSWLRDVADLDPYAAQLRYEEVGFPEALDRRWALDIARRTHEWATSALRM